MKHNTSLFNYTIFGNTLERVLMTTSISEFQFHTIFVVKSIAIRSLKRQIKLLDCYFALTTCSKEVKSGVIRPLYGHNFRTLQKLGTLTTLLLLIVLSRYNVQLPVFFTTAIDVQHPDPNGSCLIAAGLPADIVSSQSFQSFSTRQAPHLGD